MRAEFLRIAKESNKANFFYSFVKPLIFRIIKQGVHNDKFSSNCKKKRLTDIRFRK